MKTQKQMDIEEALSEIWKLREVREQEEKNVREKACSETSQDVYDELVAEKYITVENKAVAFTAQGETIARDIVRRHRLTERLFADVIDVSSGAMEETACGIEHIISADVTDAICTFLGHPRVCPHGSAIPPGPCCEKAQEHIESIVIPLNHLTAGEKGRIAYIVTSEHPYLHKLLSMGIVPGTELRVHQTSPSYVINVHETQIALDSAVAKDIYIRRV